MSMLRLITPTAVTGLLTAVYLSVSGAPARVHILSVSCLVLSYWVPAVIAGGYEGLRRRAVVCGACVLSGMVLWDAAAHTVISKVGPFSIVQRHPVNYALGFLALGTLLTLSCCVTSLLSKLRGEHNEAV